MAEFELAEKQQILFELDGSNFIEQVERIENLLINSGSSDVYVGNTEELPLTHSFSDGIYTREIFIKKGLFAIGKIHKSDHTFFLMKGKLLLCTEDGVKEIEAPYYGNASAGTKRVAIALEDTVFVNVHPNPNNIKEIEKLEDIFVVSSYEEYKNYKLLNK
jgi:quercetin dioxygenase-like cupin family protein